MNPQQSRLPGIVTTVSTLSTAALTTLALWAGATLTALAYGDSGMLVMVALTAVVPALLLARDLHSAMPHSPVHHHELSVSPRRIPSVTTLLNLTNVAVFALTAAQSQGFVNLERSSLFQAWTLHPHQNAPLSLQALLGTGFLHASPLHLVVNVLALAWLGTAVEPALGRLRFLSLYLFSLIGTSAAVYLFSSAPAVGSSGAVFGVLGAATVLAFQQHHDRSTLLWLLGFNLAITVATPHFSLLGHLGGLLTGIAVALLLMPHDDRH